MSEHYKRLDPSDFLQMLSVVLVAPPFLENKVDLSRRKRLRQNLPQGQVK